MKILVLGDLSSYHTHLFSETLARLGHEVTAASLESPLSQASSYKKIHLKTLFRKKNFFRYSTAIPGFISLYKKIQPDLVYAHFISNYGMIAKFIPGKKILSVWGSDILIVPEKSYFHKKATSKILSSFNLIHVDAKFIMQTLTSEYGIDPGKIFVFPFGPSREFFDFPRFEKVENTFITHRRIDPDMDPETVVKAFRILKDRGYNSDFRVYMVSSGSLQEKIKKLVRDLNLEETVAIPGRVSHETLLNLLGRSRFYISASLTDTTSVSLLEAMAAGCFPIVSDIPGNREWIEDGVNGLLFRPGSPDDLANKIMRAISDRELVIRGAELNKEIIKSLKPLEVNLKALLSRL